jgi:hypothetical protein
MTFDRDRLVRLQQNLEQERGRILARPRIAGANERLSPQLIRELADIEVVARAVAAELARHTPRLGYGSVS